MTCSHWLMMQSVTSYIYHPGPGPGVCLFFIDSSLACIAFGHVGEHTALYWQFGTLQAAAPAERDHPQ